LLTRRNPFPFPTPLDKVLLDELVFVAKRCYERGWSWGTAGNFSLRGCDGLIWQSPTGICKGQLRADLFIPIDLESELQLEFSPHRPSAEMPVHAGIYKCVREARCVVHTHPSAVVAYSRGRKSMTFTNEEMIKALGVESHEQTLSIPVLPNANPEDMKSYSRKIQPGVGKVAKTVVLEGHGVWAWGRTPIEALGYIEALDILCQQQR
jgi:methylthioribulose-1-phosphate dehydratase